MGYPYASWLPSFSGKGKGFIDLQCKTDFICLATSCYWVHLADSAHQTQYLRTGRGFLGPADYCDWVLCLIQFWLL